MFQAFQNFEQNYSKSTKIFLSCTNVTHFLNAWSSNIQTTSSFFDDIYTSMLDNGKRGDKVHGKSGKWLTNEASHADAQRGCYAIFLPHKVGKIA